MHSSNDNSITITPYTHSENGKKEQVEKMFDEIAFRYDLLNQLLSFGIHKRWRKKTIQLIASSAQNKNMHLLDIATGTADFAIEAMRLNPGKITGIDISKDMLAIGRKKLEEKNMRV